MLKRLLIIVTLVCIVALPAQAQKYPKKNNCVSTCDKNCKGAGDEVACFAGCMGMCVPEKTGNEKVDTQNLCEMKCAGKRSSFSDCLKECVGDD